MKKIFYFLFFVFFADNATAQHQVFELMERTDLSIREVETRANRYFDNTGTGRGTGYKQFQRWLYERKFHTDENGYFISPQTEWNNYLQSRSNMNTDATAAANWTALGPSTWTHTSSWNPGIGRLSAMAIHPANENIIYVGSPGGGLWKTTNAGANWIPLTDNNNLWMSIFSITIDPLDQNIIYIGTSTGLLLKSINAGSTFLPTGGGPSGTIRKILIQPTSTNIVFACASNGIFRSINSGNSWTQVHAGSKEDIEFKPDDVNIMYASGSDIVRSANNGVTWTTLGVAQGITNSGRTLVSVSAANPNIVYAVQASGSLFGRMYRSTDAGLSYTTTVVGNPSSGTNYFGYPSNGTGTTGQATYDMGMDVSPTNADDIYIAGIICWRSTNGGNSFTALTVWSYPNSTGYNHSDVHGLFWINSTIYSISDGGIYKSIDNGDNWTDLSAGLGIRQFYRMANSQTNANVITGGAQDNGSVTRQASGNWVDWLGADGMEGLVSPTNHLKLWGTSQNGGIYRSINGGNSYSGLSQPSTGQWVTPIAIHPTDETILYGGWTGVYKSTNSGTNWTNISSGFISGTLADLAVAPSDPNFIYASNGSTLYVTNNDGVSWTTRSAPSTINDIAVDPTNPSKIWIACNSSANRIFVSNDAGATFTNLSANLPAIAARTIVVDDNTPRGIYVGMNIGVYFKQESDANWTDYSTNLPLVAINELEIQKATNKIRVATYGRSIWESPVADVAVPGGFTFNIPAPATAVCPAASTMSITLGTIPSGGFTNLITLSATTGVPAGTNITFGTNPVVPGNSSVVNLNNANTLVSGTYVITITGNASGATTQTRDITFTISTGTGPAISAQPTNQTICAGGNTSFSISSSSATSFLWQISIDGGSIFNNLSNSTTYSGATTTVLNITGATALSNNYRYRCIASTQCGSTISSSGILTVNTSPAITAQPANTTICVGGNTSYNATATGTGVGYQWQVSTDGGSSYNNISNGGVYSGVTTATLTISGVTELMNNYMYRAVATGTCAPAAISSGATLFVISPVSITTQPVASVICSGSNISFSVAGNSIQTIIYQWQENRGSGFVNVPNGGIYLGVTTSTLSLTAVTAGMNGYQYRCQLSNTTCTAPAFSNGVSLTVRQLPTVSLVASPLTNLLPGQTTTLTATASSSTGGTISAAWLYNGTTPIPAITSNNYVVNIEHLGTYQAVIQETFTGPALVCSNQSALITIGAMVSNKLFIFPNPNDGQFIVSYYNNNGINTSRTITVYDSKGAKIYNAKFSISGPYTLLNIDMKPVLKGIYYVVVGDAIGTKLAEGKVLVH